MGLKNRLQHKGNLEEEFDEQIGEGGSHLHWETHLQPQAANRSSSLRHSPSTVSLDPLPSFLTQTPLGTPCEELVELKPMAQIPVKEKQRVKEASVPLPRQTIEQVKEAPKRFRQKAGHHKKAVKTYQGARAFGFIHRWVYEEVRLSMSKMSIVSLVLGLLFLGTLFFIIGFLAAVATIEPSTGGGGRGSQSVWQASNTPEKGGGKGFGHALGAVGGGIVGKAVGQQLGSIGKVVGASVVVPKSLQPFARYGMGRVNAEVRRDVRQVNPFVHRRKGREPAPVLEQQPYDIQQPGGVQQYASSYGGSQGGQAYRPPGSVPAPVGYQQPAAISQTGQGMQGGYNQGYAPPQQQPMMQQPYYPQPMQQQAYQQPMAPQQMMAPQQQMMLEPQYQQQMEPQQGYYR